MTTLFVEGFDGQIALPDKWGSLSGDVIIPGGGKFGGGAIDTSFEVTANFTDPSVPINPRGSLLNPIHVACYVKVIAGSGNNQSALIELRQSSGGIGTNLIVTNALTLGLVKWDGNTDKNDPLVAAGGSLSVGQWNHIEFKYAAHDVNGVAKAWLNGLLVIDFTGDTLFDAAATPSGNGAAAVHLHEGSSSTLQAIYDDLIVWDEEGPGINTAGQLGLHRIETLIPVSDSSVQFAPTGAGTTNANRVSEAGADNDATYVESSINGNIDMYDYSDMVGTPSAVHGIMVQTRATNPGVDSVSVKARILQNAVAAVGAASPLSTGGVYTQHSKFYNLNPDGSVAWTKDTVNSTTIGHEAVII